jgi:N-acetylglutamate synthase-like GNAT family acetyltransferase
VSDVIASLLLAAIGSAVTFLVQVSRRRYRNRRLREQYPVAGLFATEFEDKSDDGLVVQKGLTRIRQHGMEIVGVTSELQTGRCWKLKGKISSEGFISGVYVAEDPHDTGNGTFFVEVDGATGDMQGLWAGYDSVHHSIEGGKYRFRRCPETDIRRAEHHEAKSLVALLGDALGDRYVEYDEVIRLIEGANSELCLVAKTETRGIAGAATASIISQEALSGSFPKGQSHVLSELPMSPYHENVGLIQAVAVSNLYRERGIATQLTRSAMDWLREQQATIALSFGWKSPEGCHIAGVFESCGFNPVREVENFWLEDSKNAGYSCPSCGDVCGCDAVIFTRSLIDMPANPCRV